MSTQITYELARQLKDAGFKPEQGCEHCGSLDCLGTDDEFNPTLSELIEACIISNDESDGRYSFKLERKIVLDKD